MPNGPEVARAYVTIIPSMQGAQQEITKELAGISDTAGAAGGESAGKSFTQKLTGSVGKAGGALTKGLGIATKAAAGLTVGVGALAAGLTAYTDKVSAHLDQIDKQSQKTGVSAEAYQELDYVLQLAGADIGVMQGGMKTLTNQMQSAAEGNKKAAAAFDALGISATNADGSLRSQEEVMWEAFDALNSMSNETEKAALATDIFGRAGTELLPLLNGEAGSIAAARQEAHDLGLVMSDDMVKSGAALQDSMTRVKSSFATVGTQLGGALIPIVTKAADFITAYMPQIQSMVEKIAPVVADLFDKLLPPLFDLVDALLPPIISLLEVLLPIVSKVISVGVSLIGSVVKFLEPYLTGLINVIREIIPTVQNVVAKVVGFFQNLRDKVKGIIDKIKGFFKFDWSLPKIKMPHFSITGTFSLSPLQVPKLSIDWYKRAAEEGAVFSRPTVIGVGDASQPEMLLGKNTLRDMIRESTGGNNNVVLNVYGAEGQNVRELADIVMDRIETMTQRKVAALT